MLFFNIFNVIILHMGDIMSDDNIYIGKKIKEYREHKNLTQEDMAKELDIAPNHYGRIERGENSCTTKKLIKICNILHTDANSIIGGLIITPEHEFEREYDKLSIDDKKQVLEFMKFLNSRNKN